MDNFLLGLVGGVGLIIIGNWLLIRIAALGAIRSAMVVALASMGIYLPLAVLHWPGGDVLAIHLAVYLLASYVCGVLLRPREQPEAGGKQRRLHWGPALLIGFFVGLFVVLAVFVMLAEHGLPPQWGGELFSGSQRKLFSGFPGVVSHDFQQKEALYNDYLLQMQRQHERGWQIQKGWMQPPVAGKPALFQVEARTRTGQFLSGAEVTGRFLRTSDSRLDTAFTLHETEPGIYQETLTLPAAGRWDLVLQVRKGEDWHEIRASTSVAAPHS